jgi:TonB-linked SusC/RagA family outer membrane protein
MKTKWRRIALTTLAILIFSVNVLAQHAIRGTLRSPAGEPVAGATITVKGTTSSTTTDANGQFSINAPVGSMLTISHVQYTAEEVKVGDQTSLDIQMRQLAVQDLEQAVVVGYGTQKKADIVSSVASISGKELANYKTANAALAMQGQLPGVRVIQNSGNPGAQPNIFIRGVYSALGGTNPLLVVDGAPVYSGYLNSINPDDIERIDVLKDAAAASIYGSNAANGVILITTKRGKSGQNNLTFDIGYQIQSLKKPYTMADPTEYLKVVRLKNPAFVPDVSPARGLDTTKNTDWWNEALNKNAPILIASLSYLGGTEKSSYGASFSYTDQQSQAKVGYWKRVTGRFSGDFRINSWLKMGGVLAPRYETWINTPTDFLGYLSTDPITPERRPPGLAHVPSSLRPLMDEEFSGYTYPFGGAANGPTNYVAGMYIGDLDKNQLYGVQSSGYIEINPVKHVTFKSQLSANVDNSTNSFFRPRFYIDAQSGSLLTQAGTGFTTAYNWVFFNTLTYKNTFATDHNLTVLLGQEAQEIKSYNGGGSRYSNTTDNNELFRFADFIREDLNQTDVRAAANGNLPYGGINQNTWTKLASYFGRAEYNYASKYYLTASLRRDGNSRFPKSDQYAYFPSVSAGWRISSENFMNSSGWLTNLMVKARYGVRGNYNAINRQSQYNTISTGNLVAMGGVTVFATLPAVQGNPNLKWENDQDAGAGFEALLLKGKLRVEFDYFNNKTKQTLLNLPLIPDQTLADNSQLLTNVGTISNKGWELTLGYRDAVGKVNYDARMILSQVKSTFDDIGFNGFLEVGSNDQYREAERFGNLGRIFSGGVVGAFYGYKVIGVFQSQAEIDAYVDKNGAKVMPSAKAGDFKYQDANGDGTITTDDKIYLGNPYPKLTADWSLRLNYSGFDLIADIYGSYGHDVFNTTKRYLVAGDRNSNVIAGSYDQLWKGSGTSTTNPSPNASLLSFNANSWFIEKGSFTRIRNIQLGYTFPTGFVKDIKSLRVYASVQNIATFTSYSGVNPEVQSNSQLYQGVDRAQYPLPRIFAFGVTTGL